MLLFIYTLIGRHQETFLLPFAFKSYYSSTHRALLSFYVVMSRLICPFHQEPQLSRLTSHVVPLIFYCCTFPDSGALCWRVVIKIAIKLLQVRSGGCGCVCLLKHVCVKQGDWWKRRCCDNSSCVTVYSPFKLYLNAFLFVPPLASSRFPSPLHGPLFVNGSLVHEKEKDGVGGREGHAQRVSFQISHCCPIAKTNSL